MTETVIVGVDGSEPSNEALVWALREAKLRNAQVVAIHVGVVPWSMGYDVKWHEDRELLKEDARQEIERQVETARVAADAPDVPVEARALIDERAGYTLASLAAGADLLVVGNRGRGGFSGALLGSVSTTAVHHATCPVVVVRA
jgi:nucleotide-binding universal stress UspA family protein